ncbi:MAG: hypothetical protein B7Y93_06625 [Micrococcales bacterium 32-70-13]|nr:MAG: hypothetical protein B7Y93_06625 [Micrococcales bacterium 32-70-13]
MTATLLFFLAAGLLVAIGGLLASIDAALGVVSRIELVDIAASRKRPARLHAVAADVGAHVNALNFLRIVAETIAAVLVTIGFATLIDEWWWVLLISAGIMIGVSFILVGSSPRSVGRAHPRAMLGTFDWLIRGVRLLTGPLADALVVLGNRVTPGRPSSASFSSEEQLLNMVDEATELDVLEEEDRELIHSIFEFNDTIVREVMVPRTDMIVLEQGATVAEAMSLFLSRGVSRVPVVGESTDEVLGVVYLRDASRLTLIEELVGEIVDEYDRESADSERLGENSFRVSARMPVDELGDLFGIELDDDDVDSVGGLLAKHLGRLPVRGSTVTIDGLHLTAERTEGRRKRVVTVLVEADQALLDARIAFAGDRDRSDREESE